MNNYLNILHIILFVFLSSASVAAEGQRVERTYPLPMAELEDFISGWLITSGFKVQKTGPEAGRVMLNAVRSKEFWQILLKPHSPLATKVRASYIIEEQPDPVRINELWRLISEYISAPSSGHIAGTWDTNPGIPDEVLSNLESVVCIKAKNGNQNTQVSGFIIDKDGLIVCTAHGLKGCQDISVVLHDGQTFKGHIIRKDFQKDLSLVRIDAGFDRYIPLDHGEGLLSMGERVYSAGCPISLSGTVFSGVINGPLRRVKDLLFWQVNMEIHLGSSGSPVFDVQGNLVAVVKGRHREADSVGFLIPLGTVLEFIEDK